MFSLDCFLNIQFKLFFFFFFPKFKIVRFFQGDMLRLCKQ